MSSGPVVFWLKRRRNAVCFFSFASQLLVFLQLLRPRLLFVRELVLCATVVALASLVGWVAGVFVDGFF